MQAINCSNQRLKSSIYFEKKYELINTKLIINNGKLPGIINWLV